MLRQSLLSRAASPATMARLVRLDPETAGAPIPAAPRRLDTLARLLDNALHGVALLDDAGRVLMLNRMARDIMASADGLSLYGERLVADRPDLTRRLHAAIGAAASPAPARRALSLPRPSGRTNLLIVASPLDPVGPALEGEPAVALEIAEPDRRKVLDADLLADLFDLTQQEARVARCMMLGLTIGEAAEELGISNSTARFHLAALFRKTGTARQADLTTLLASAPGLTVSDPATDA